MQTKSITQPIPKLVLENVEEKANVVLANIVVEDSVVEVLSALTFDSFLQII